MQLEILEDRTLLSPVLTVTNLTINGSNGAIVSNGGTWFDDPGATLGLMASAGNVTRNTDRTWSWSFTTPTGPASQAVTITGDDGSGYKAFATFYLNPTLRTVRNTSDSGSGSLRQAILDTNGDTVGVDEIVFALKGTGPFTIQPATPLDPITTPVLINGYSQPGSSPNTNSVGTNGLSADNANRLITLDGSQVPLDTSQAGGNDGLAISVGGSTVTGLVIQHFTTDIHLTVNGNDTIRGNLLTDATGFFYPYAGHPGFLLGQNGVGLFVDNVPNNTIGGTIPAARNVMGNNSDDATDIIGTGANSNVVEGNYLGTDGTQMTGSGRGVIILDGSNNVVGGTAPGAGNVIASTRIGIRIVGDTATASGNVVQGNYIGPNAAGTGVPNGLGFIIGVGVWINGLASNTTIGGTTPSARNVISGWPDTQVDDESILTGDVVEGNYIGTNAAGSCSAGSNQGDGIGALRGGGKTVSGNLISGVGGIAVGIDDTGGTTCRATGSAPMRPTPGLFPMPGGWKWVGSLGRATS